MTKVLFCLLILLFAPHSPALAQNWEEREAYPPMRAIGVKRIHQQKIPNGIIYVMVNPKSSVLTIGVQLITRERLSILDTIHCNIRGERITLDKPKESYSARTEEGQGEEVEIPYLPLVAIWAAPVIDLQLPIPEAGKCYELYEQESYKELIKVSKVWKIDELDREEKGSYAYKFLTENLVILVSQNQERIKIIASQDGTVHWIEMEGRYQPKVVAEEWKLKTGETLKPDLIRRNLNLRPNFFLLMTVRRSVENLLK